MTLAVDETSVGTESVIVLRERSKTEVLLFVCLPKDGNIQVVHLQHRLHDALQSRGIVAVEELQQRIRDVILRRKPKDLVLLSSP